MCVCVCAHVCLFVCVCLTSCDCVCVFVCVRGSNFMCVSSWVWVVCVSAHSLCLYVWMCVLIRFSHMCVWVFACVRVCVGGLRALQRMVAIKETLEWRLQGMVGQHKWSLSGCLTGTAARVCGQESDEAKTTIRS